jgi:hypothetical protein
MSISYGTRAHRGADADAHVRLMTGGRLHGQAFVRFESVERATKALDSVLGYMLQVWRLEKRGTR